MRDTPEMRAFKSNRLHGDAGGRLRGLQILAHHRLVGLFENTLSESPTAGCLMGEMQEKSDAQLLCDYAERGLDSAFRELVTRHTDLVYSAALRQVESPDLAADIAQSVFVDLARKAKPLSERMSSDASLAGWLHRGTRYTALNHLRDSRRRSTNERQAMEQLLTNSESSVDWGQTRPVLDEALDSLGDEDREALLLRYFKNQDFRAVGLALGVSDDAAQKRVSRAVESLRAFFVKRGVTIGASGLVVAISANAVQAAPVGLAVSIFTGAALAGTAIQTSTVITSAKIIAMTTLQKAALTATLVAAIGTGIYEARQAARRHDPVQALPPTPPPTFSPVTKASVIQSPVKPKRTITVQPTKAPTPVSFVKKKSAAVPVTETRMYELLKQKVPQLTRAQVDPYLAANERNAASLLAAFRTTTDQRLLAEAVQNFPHDPQVAFEAAIQKDASPENRRKSLDAFKEADPENSLADYLSALDHFKTGKPQETVQDLVAAAGKSQFQDYAPDRKQTDEEAYLAAGYPPGEAKLMGNVFLIEPQLAQFRELGKYLIDMAGSYQQRGDSNSQRNAIQMCAELGRRFGDPSTGEPLLNQLVGISIERMALAAMNPASTYGTDGQTVQQRLDQLLERKESIHVLSAQADPLWEKLSDQDWTTYYNQIAAVGEEAALRWMVGNIRLH